VLVQNAGCVSHPVSGLPGLTSPHISAPPLQIGSFGSGYVGVRTGLTAPRALQVWLHAKVVGWRSRKALAWSPATVTTTRPAPPLSVFWPAKSIMNIFRFHLKHVWSQRNIVISTLHHISSGWWNQRRMWWSGRVERMGDSMNVWRVCVWKPKGNSPLGKSRRRWKDINSKKSHWRVYRSDLAQEWDKWWALV